MKTLGDIFERSCISKRPHATKRDAEIEAQRMSRLERTPFKYYLCDCCGRWHVAHQERKQA